MSELHFTGRADILATGNSVARELTRIDKAQSEEVLDLVCRLESLTKAMREGRHERAPALLG